MENKRTFIAIDFPLDPEIADLISRLRKEFHDEKMKWAEPDNLHLTLRFFGDTTAARIEAITKGLEALAVNYPPFTARISGLGQFVKNGVPGIIWAGVELPEWFQELVDAIETLAVEAGFERETKPFKAHLTLCRIKSIRQREKLKGIIEKERGRRYAEEPIDSIVFYESILRPQGPLYRAIRVIPFGGSSQEPGF